MTERISFPTEDQKEAMRELHAKLHKLAAKVRERRDQLRAERDAAPFGVGLIYDYEGTRLWNLQDVAAVMGRDAPFIEALFKRVREDPSYPVELKDRLEELAYKNEAYSDRGELYGDDVFDFVFDCWAEDYLRRLCYPKRDRDLPTADDILRIRRFWEGLKGV